MCYSIQAHHYCDQLRLDNCSFLIRIAQKSNPTLIGWFGDAAAVGYVEIVSDQNLLERNCPVDVFVVVAYWT